MIMLNLIKWQFSKEMVAKNLLNMLCFLNYQLVNASLLIPCINISIAVTDLLWVKRVGLNGQTTPSVQQAIVSGPCMPSTYIL